MTPPEQYSALVWKEDAGTKYQQYAMWYEFSPGIWELATPSHPSLWGPGTTVESWAENARYLLKRTHSDIPEHIIKQVEEECIFVPVTLTFK